MKQRRLDYEKTRTRIAVSPAVKRYLKKMLVKEKYKNFSFAIRALIEYRIEHSKMKK